MKNEDSLTQQLQEQGYPSVGRIQRVGGSPQNIIRKDGWIRSKARVNGGSVHLDAEFCEEYYPEREGSLVLMDFLNLDICDQDAIINFVEKYGLLSNTGLESGYENLGWWAEAHSRISDLIQLHFDIQRAKNDEMRAFNDLATITDNKYIEACEALDNRTDLTINDISVYKNIVERYNKGLFGNSKTEVFREDQKQNLMDVANSILASCISFPMEEITVGVSYHSLYLKKRNQQNPTRSLVLDYKAPDLYRYLWLQVAFWAIDGKNLGLCICGCGRFFPMTRVDRKYYSDGCGGSIRGKRGRAKAEIFPLES